MRLLAIPVTLALCCAALPAAADCGIGTLSRTFGEVSLARDGATAPAGAGSDLCTGDRFVTGPDGVAELAFRDGTRVTVGKDSDFRVARWQERRFRRNDALFELAQGAFRAVTGAITQRRHRFEVQTVIATIGVRGTDFWGGLNLTPDALEVIMLEGKGVYVRNDAGAAEIRQPGTGTTVTPGAAPTTPTAWGEEKLSRAVGTITP